MTLLRMPVLASTKPCKFDTRAAGPCKQFDGGLFGPASLFGSVTDCVTRPAWASVSDGLTTRVAGFLQDGSMTVCRWMTIAALLAAAAALNTAASSSPGFHFAILGDRTGEAQPGVYEEVWREIDASHPDFVISVGDTIEGGSDRTAAAEWSALQPLLKQYAHCPLYFTPGNHDIWSEQSKRIYERETGRPVHYGFNYENAHFTILDNSGGGLPDSEIQFLAADLERNKSKDPKFVFCHEPFWLIPVMLGTAHTPFGDLLARYRVANVVSGHAHRFGRFVQDGVTFLLVGSSGGHLRGQGFDSGWFFHHVEVNVKGSDVQFTVVECEKPFGQGRKFRAEDWSLTGLRR